MGRTGDGFIRNAGLDEAHLESGLPGKISITLDIQRTTPYGRKHRGAKESFDEND